MGEVEQKGSVFVGVGDHRALLEGLFAHAPFAVEIVARDGTITAVNDAFVAMFHGAPPPGYNLLEDPVVRDQGFLPLAEAAFRGETIRVPPHWFIPRLAHHTDKQLALEIQMFPLVGEGGEVTHIAGVFKDVTAELRLSEANEALHQREEELNATLLSMGDACIATDMEGRVVRMNPVAEKLTGWPLAEARGLPLDEVFHIINEDTRQPVESPVSNALRRGAVVGLANHTVLVARDGSERAIADSAAPIFDSSRVVRGVVLIFRDVSDEQHAERLRREQEEALRRSEEMLLLALNASKSMAWSLDFVTGTTTFSGNAAELGVSTSDTQEERMRKIHPEDRPLVLEGLAAARKGLQPPSYTYRIRRSFDDDYRWIEARSVFFRDEQGTATGAVGLAIDVTDRLRAVEMKQRAAELELQNQQVREASRMKSEFLANMSHELRTPLNAITGFAQLLHDGQVSPADPEHHEFLAGILTSAGHLLQLINDVLDLSKIEAGKLEFFPEPVVLADTFTEVCGILRPIATNKAIQVAIDVQPGLDGIELDPARLKQVLYNYLSNALKFTPEGGRVVVRARPDGEAELRIEVEDTGPGIAAQDLSRLFVDFEQLERGPNKRYGGTGLGLALTRRLVEAQGGRVGVNSAPARGSVFFAVLPRVASTVQSAGAVTSSRTRSQ